MSHQRSAGRRSQIRQAPDPGWGPPNVYLPALVGSWLISNPLRISRPIHRQPPGDEDVRSQPAVSARREVGSRAAHLTRTVPTTCHNRFVQLGMRQNYRKTRHVSERRPARYEQDQVVADTEKLDIAVVVRPKRANPPVATTELDRTDIEEADQSAVFLSRLLVRPGRDGKLQKFGLTASELDDLHRLVGATVGWHVVGFSGGITAVAIQDERAADLVSVLELPAIRKRFGWAAQLAAWTRKGGWHVWI
jgi:hypothetical protein